jgi:flavodoxin
MNKNLIAYFSRPGENYIAGKIVSLPTGNTQLVAEKLQRLTGGDLFRIETVKPYSEFYTVCTEEAKTEFLAKARPPLVRFPESIEKYDLIFLGFPNWWGTMPMSLFTFLEHFDFSDKTIAPFCTHEGSGLGKSERDIKKCCPTASLLPGFEVRGSQSIRSDQALANWLAEIDLVF